MERELPFVVNAASVRTVDRRGLAAAVNPTKGPTARVLQCLLFATEVVKRVELIARFSRLTAGALEQQIG